MAGAVVFVYGCYGYTGTLICEEAAKRGLKIIVGGSNPALVAFLSPIFIARTAGTGRNREKCLDIAKRFKLDPSTPDDPSDDVVRVFDLSDEKAVAEQLATLPDSCKTVMNVAGPYVETFDVMVSACFTASLNYLDVTGEIEVFESACLDYGAKFEDKGLVELPGCGIDVVPTDCLAARLKRLLPGADMLEVAVGLVVLPGCGIDVVPTDCLAARLKRLLPSADTLEVAVGQEHADSSKKGQPLLISRGTARTAVTQLGVQTLGRRDGKVQSIDHVFQKVPLATGNPQTPVTNISMGDVSTAYHTTGIPNITYYLQCDGALKWNFWLNSFAAVRWLTRILPKSLKSGVLVPEWGPSDEERESTRSTFWGRAIDSKTGKSVSSRFRSKSTYNMTYTVAVEIMCRIAQMSSEQIREKAGFQTPARMFGESLITDCDPTIEFTDDES